MQAKSIVLSSIVGLTLVAGNAFALQTTVKFTRDKGYFTCDFEKGAGADALIATTHVLVRGPKCDGHGVMHLTAEQLKKYSFAYKTDGASPNARVEVYGDAQNLTCITDQNPRPIYDAGWCVVPPSEYNKK